jgi:hypothetical protein
MAALDVRLAWPPPLGRRRRALARGLAHPVCRRVLPDVQSRRTCADTGVGELAPYSQSRAALEPLHQDGNRRGRRACDEHVQVMASSWTRRTP